MKILYESGLDRKFKTILQSCPIILLVNICIHLSVVGILDHEFFLHLMSTKNTQTKKIPLTEPVIEHVYARSGSKCRFNTRIRPLG